MSVSPAPEFLNGFPYVETCAFTCEQINYPTCFAIGIVSGFEKFAIGQGDVFGGVKKPAIVASATRESTFVFAWVMFTPAFELTTDQLVSERTSSPVSKCRCRGYEGANGRIHGEHVPILGYDFLDDHVLVGEPCDDRDWLGFGIFG